MIESVIPFTAIEMVNRGGADWDTPGRGLSEDDKFTYTSLAALGYSNYLRAYIPNVTGIPSDNVLVGMQLEILVSLDYGEDRSVWGDSVKLLNSGILLADRGELVTDWKGRVRYVVYGGSGDLWGSTRLTIASLANISALVGCSCILPNTVFVDNIRLRVWSEEAVPLDPILITQEPAFVKCLQYSDAYFSVESTGGGLVTYQWYKYPNTIVTGASGKTLYLPDVLVADAGSYFCAITSEDSVEIVNSHNAGLEVVPRSIGDISSDYTLQWRRRFRRKCGIWGVIPVN
jgi:hypothetical protein